MKLNLALLSATALTVVLTVPVLADNNKIYLDQNGASNVATVDQSAGENNQFGNSLDALRRATQSGNSNILYAYQSGSHNKIGATGYNDFDQQGGHNDAFLVQTGSGNAIADFVQFGSGTATSAVNKAVVLQNGTNGSVDAVSQTFRGPGAVNLLDIAQGVDAGDWNNTIGNASQRGHSNTLYLRQYGSWNSIGTAEQGKFQPGQHENAAIYQGLNKSVDAYAYIHQEGDYNTIAAVKQYGDANYANIQQVGSGNKIVEVGQAGENSAVILIHGGNNNGGQALTGAAADSGVPHSSSIQIGEGNSVGMAISGGNHNGFGFSQNGIDNVAVGIAISGDYNQIGVSQTGTSNELQFAPITGDSNNIGLLQDGTDNLANVWINGNNNSLGMLQDGDLNQALVGVAGDHNEGLITQLGNVNLTAINIGGSFNDFTTLQNGNSNTVNGTVTGSWNIADIAQVGNTNTVNFSQNGNGNTADLSQNGTNNLMTIIQ